MALHPPPPGKVRNFRHLLGCDTIVEIRLLLASINCSLHETWLFFVLPTYVGIISIWSSADIHGTDLNKSYGAILLLFPISLRRELKMKKKVYMNNVSVNIQIFHCTSFKTKRYSKNPLIRNPLLKISLFCFLYIQGYYFQEQPEMHNEMFLNLIDKKLSDSQYFYFLFLAVIMILFFNFTTARNHGGLKNSLSYT